jgi:hypothetical protein
MAGISEAIEGGANAVSHGHMDGTEPGDGWGI